MRLFERHSIELLLEAWAHRGRADLDDSDAGRTAGDISFECGGCHRYGVGARWQQGRAIDRRHLVLAMTDGIDTYSAIRPETLRLVAARTDAVLHIVHARSAFIGTPRYMPGDRRYALLPYNQRHFERAIWGPLDPFIRAAYLDFDEYRLRQIAVSTGGELHGPTLLGTGTVGAFTRVFNEFRQTYLLRFTPEGVDRAGWHELSVTVPNRRS